jgi:hypothetical protein
MRSVLEVLVANVGTHLSDDTLSRVVSGELPSARSRRAKRHLSKCWKCRSRHEELERAAMGFVELHKQIATPNPPEAPEWREMFLARLDQAASEIAPAPWWSRFVFHLRSAWLANMNPVIASVVVVAVACLTLLVIWQRSIPSVSAAELLERAETSENSLSHTNQPGVVYQKIHIRSKYGTLDRDLYRDREGRRQPKSEAVSDRMAMVKAKLSIAGVSWDDPLSASSYKAWHDKQVVERDVVRRPEKSLLKLTTKTEGGVVVQESLTVREADFHPVKRTVELVDLGTVEIEELNYAVLSWDAVNAGMFESPLPPVSPAPPAALPRAPSARLLPSPQQLEDAELQARLALNHVNADTSEQIRVERSDTAVEIKGIVETEERKQQLITSLRSIPHVSSSILSVEELRTQPRSESSVTSVQQYSSVGQPSPLQQYMTKKGLTGVDLNRVSRELLDACLVVQREASGLSELQSRFSSTEQLSVASRSALNELKTNHLAGLVAGLDAEVAQLGELDLPSVPDVPLTSSIDVSEIDLEPQVRTHQLLCQELITGGGDQQRSAAAIASDIFASVDRLRSAAERLGSQGH